MSKVHEYNRKSDGGAFALRAPDVFKSTIQASLNGAAGVAVWTPAAGKQIRLMGCIPSGATAGAITLFDTSVAGATVVGVSIDNTQRSEYIPFPGAGIPVSVGNPLVAKGPAGLSNIVVFGVEEVPSSE